MAEMIVRRRLIQDSFNMKRIFERRIVMVAMALILVATLFAFVGVRRAGAVDSAHMACAFNPTVLGNGGAVADVLDVPGDFDCFAFDAVAGYRYELNVNLGMAQDAYCQHWSRCTGPILSDSVMMLSTSFQEFPFLTQENVIMVDDDGGPGLASKITFTAETTGRHYIYVRGYSANNHYGVYTVRIHATAVIVEDPCAGSWWLPECWAVPFP